MAVASVERSGGKGHEQGTSSHHKRDEHRVCISLTLEIRTRLADVYIQ